MYCFYKIMASNKSSVKGKNKNKKTKTKTKRTLKNLKCIPRRIPADVLKETLDILHQDDNPIWIDKKKSCFKSVDRSLEKGNIVTVETSTKLKYARQCLLKRDFKNLAKILTMNCFNDTTHTSCVLPTFAKYAALCLLHEDKARLEALVSTLTSNNATDFLEMCTTYPSGEDNV